MCLVCLVCLVCCGLSWTLPARLAKSYSRLVEWHMGCPLRVRFVFFVGGGQVVVFFFPLDHAAPTQKKEHQAEHQSSRLTLGPTP